MIIRYHSRKLEQLKILARRVQYLLKQKNEKASEQLNTLRDKLNKLLHELRFTYSRFELKRILGTAILLFGLSFSNDVKAQWYANPVENPFSLDSVSEIAVPAIVDLDGDGDLDMLVGDYYGDLHYFENIGTSTNPTFDDAQLNPFGIETDDYQAFPAFVDIDDDGDFDLFIGSSNYDYYSYEYSGKLNFLENTGTATNPQFAPSLENPFNLESIGNLPFSSFVDLDDDGDFDILIGTAHYEYISYDDYSIYGRLNFFENIGSASSANFESPVENPFGLSETSYLASPTLGDIDNDGDMDLFVGEYYGNFQYFENTGTDQNPAFTSPVENPFGLVSVYQFALPVLADLDNDGDLDLMVGEYYGVFQYFENINSVGIDELNQQTTIQLYPNPVTNLLRIDSEDSIDRIDFIDLLGRNSLSIMEPTNQLSVSELEAGIYTVKVYFKNGKQAINKIVKE